MNYYERHIGDYLKDTAHLSLLEHGIYTRLLDVYYTRESAIPDDQVARLIGARTKDEKDALHAVLTEFFTKTDSGWAQDRCDREIERYRDGEPEREIKKANESNRVKRHRDERANLFKALTDAGQHAPWNIGIVELREMVKRLGLNAPDTKPATATDTQPVTAPATPATATHTPVPSTHTPDTIPNESPSLRSGDSAVQAPRRASKGKKEEVTLKAFLTNCKQAGVKPVPDDHYIRQWCVDADIPVEMLQVAWVVFRDKYLGDEKLKGKRYKDWPGHFANSVKERWYGLWFVGEDGKPQWTHTGLQRKQVLENRMEAEHVSA